MHNFWLVAKHEYRTTVGRRGFLIATLAVPLGIAALVALSVFVFEVMGQDNSPVGYVDHSGILDASRHADLEDADERIEVRAYPDEASARAALERGEIQAFWVIPADYPQTLNTDLYYQESPPSNDVWVDFDDFVRINLIATFPADVQQRLFEGPDITVHDTVSNREFSESSMINIILPFVATFFFFFATMMGAGYMLGVVANEKENRTMEVMLTSVTPGQLIGGKTLGLLAATLTQLAIYAVAAVVGLVLAGQYVPELQQVVVPWDYLAVMVLFFLPAYALLAGIMVAIGAVVTELQQGQQIAGILNLFFMLPVFLLPVLFENPNHPLMIFFTLFPITSFLTVSLRWGLGTVPLWQIGVGWVLLVAAAILMIWAAARVFRAGMLRYGQPLDFKAAAAAIRGK
jgi:ABC-2 type transport system permease protein